MINTASHQHISLIERIQTHYNSLKNAERKVADYLIANPNQLLESSITEFSRDLGVSEATISRFSKAVGYDGFPALKLSIASEASRTTTLPNMPSEIREDDSFEDMSKKLLSTLSLSMQMTNSCLESETFKTAVDQISAAKRMVFIGVGGAASICVEAMHLFVKAGRHAETISDGYTQITTATNMGKNDLLVGVSHTGQTRSVAQSLAIAAENGAATIAITSNGKSDVARAANLALTTWNSKSSDVPFFGDFLEGRIAQIFLIDLLYLAVLFRSQNGEKDNLMTTGDELKRYYDQG